MPKVKTNSGAKKRFVLTGTGKVKRHHAFHSHILTKKTKKQKRNLDHSAIVVTENMKQVRDLLCLRYRCDREHEAGPRPLLPPLNLC